MKREQTLHRLIAALSALPGGESAVRLARRARAGGLRLGAESVPPGHFYSVIPSAEDLRRAEVAGAVNEPPLGVDLNIAEQVRLLQTWLSLREDVPFYSPQRRVRFDIENGSFSYDDAPVLSYMLRTILSTGYRDRLWKLLRLHARRL